MNRTGKGRLAELFHQSPTPKPNANRSSAPRLGMVPRSPAGDHIPVRDNGGVIKTAALVVAATTEQEDVILHTVRKISRCFFTVPAA